MASRDSPPQPYKSAGPYRIQTGAQMWIFEHGCNPLVGESQTERQRGIIQCLARSERDSSRHIGDAIMNDAIYLVSWIRMRCQARGLEASALIDSDIYNHLAFAYRAQHAGADQLRRARAGNAHRTNDDVRRNTSSSTESIIENLYERASLACEAEVSTGRGL